MTDYKQLKSEFWDKVIEVSPDDINSDTIKVVSDQNIDWLITKVEAKAKKEAVEGFFDYQYIWIVKHKPFHYDLHEQQAVKKEYLISLAKR